MRPLDIVVFGATGASGAQITRLLADRVAGGARNTLGIAGRDAHRLEALAASLPAAVAVVVCDAHDAAGLAQLAARTAVVISTVAPYVEHGEPLVAACAREGTDYLDLCAETAHIKRLIEAHHATAVRSGARLVPTCGFDAAISDHGVSVLREWFRSRGTVATELRALYRCAGSWNAGTSASARALWQRPADADAMRDPFLLLPADAPRPNNSLHADPIAARWDPDVQRWVSPFWMGPINTRVVRRSFSIAPAEGEPRLPPVYHEYWDPGGPAHMFLAQAAAASWGAWQEVSRQPLLAEVASQAARPWLALARVVPATGFRALFLARGADGSRAWTRIHSPLDPANAATAAIATEAALLLAATRGRAAPGGVLTPATAFGPGLGNALVRHGIRTDCPVAPSWAQVQHV